MRKRKEWFAGTIIYDGNGGHDTKFLVVRQRINVNGHTHEKIGFAGGMRSKNDHTIQRTANRETRDETGLRLKDENTAPESIFSGPGLGHKKVLLRFPLSAFEGELRKEEVPDGDYIISPPEWMTLTELRHSPILPRFHREGLEDTARDLGLVR